MSVHPWVSRWLFLGVLLILVQVFIGGVTRLTGSGLSITKWEIVQGAIPPMSHTEWTEEFELYKQTPQYHKINKGMSLSDFKFIYFWEYFHRLWARMMGFVFLFPVLFFFIKGWIPKWLIPRLVTIFLLAGLVGSFGWIMVKSGLVNRPWVNAYKLTLHFSFALICLGYVFWTGLKTLFPERQPMTQMRSSSLLLFGLVCFQLILGGLMSGMKAGLLFPTWPDMNGTFIPESLLDPSVWSITAFLEYDTNPAVPTLVQFLHRMTAYLVLLLSIFFVIRLNRTTQDVLFKRGGAFLLIILGVQIVLGVLTLINSIGLIPLWLGVFHQAVAVILLCNVLFLVFLSKSKPIG